MIEIVSASRSLALRVFVDTGRAERGRTEFPFSSGTTTARKCRRRSVTLFWTRQLFTIISPFHRFVRSRPMRCEAPPINR